MSVRDARPGESARIREITLAAYSQYASAMAPAAWRALERAILGALDGEAEADRIVAEREGRLVGSVLLFAPASDAYGGAVGRVEWPEVRLLSVAPEARGEGVGKALMDECVRRAREAGAAELGLHTSASMTAAIRLYEGMGFRRAPERDFQPEGAELVTAYRLPLGAGDSP